MAFFLKLTVDATSWGWCYARAIRQRGESVLLVDPHVPTPGGGVLSIGGGEYPWSRQSGWLHAYDVPSRLPWLSESERPPRFPAWIPAAYANEGMASAAAYALRGSKLRHVFEHEGTRWSLAEDAILDSVAGILRAPEFIPSDAREFDAWRALRPEAHAFATEDARRIGEQSGLTGDLLALRTALRIEAHRKIDHIKDHFASTPSLAQEAFVSAKTSIGPVLIGRIKGATYRQGEGVEPIIPEARNSALVDELENVLLPGAGPINDRLQWVKWQREFALWEECHACPAFGYQHWGDTVPDGLVFRPGLRQTGWTIPELSRLGMYPVISDVALRFLQSRKIELASAEDSAAQCLSRVWREPTPSAAP